MVDESNIGRVLAAVRRSGRAWKVPVVGLYRDHPYATLVSCLLSLRTKDETTAAASARLFRLARTPRAMLRRSLREIERAIYPVGFYRTKARTIRALSKTLVVRHGGEVPRGLDALLALDGVGRKTANLVITLAFGDYGICVDTHVHRISNRWGFIRARTPDESELRLRERLPRRHWRTYNDLLVAFGQNLCRPTSPWCSRCPVADVCARVGVVRSR